MKKIAAVLALSFASVAYAEPAMLPSHAVQSVAMQSLGDLVPVTIQAVSFAATTYTQGVTTPTVAIATASSGSESAPTLATEGLSLDGLSGVTVMLKTASNATAGGTLQCYVWNPEALAWYRVPDLDLTAIAATTQSWPGIWIPVSRGRVTWVPNGIGAVVTTVYMVGMQK